jgi:hypothetical protein
MTNLTDTQQPITETTRGTAFPYEFGLDFFKRKVVVFNKVNNKVASFHPSDLQRLAADETLDPHRHALYEAAWSYWQSQQMNQSPRGTL